MPRKPRITLPGYYHIINRGVERRPVFVSREDYDYFIELLCTYAKEYGITIHNYCLMNNHYHLLIETVHPNLSVFMRQLNMNYAIYFNKKEQRTGHLWQGRYQSWFVTDEAYLYTLILYIEHNPVKADVVERAWEYPYSSAHLFLKPDSIPPCLANAWIAQNYQNDTGAIKAFLDSKPDSGELAKLKKAASLVKAPIRDNTLDWEKLRKSLQKAKDTKERNRLIVQAYREGYSQHGIAKVLGLAQSTIHGIIKRAGKKDAITFTWPLTSISIQIYRTQIWVYYQQK